MSNPIITENALAGTTAWNLVSGGTTQIQAYCDKTSYNPNDTVTFYISTQSGGTTFTLYIYRLGWYNGRGGRLLFTSTSQTGVAQGYFDGTTLQSCPTAISDGTTHNLEAGWASSYTWSVPANAVTGIYEAKLVDQSANEWYVFFVVKGNATADYLYSRPDTTDAAYNNWGGYSLYTNPTVGTKVSFNRPDYNLHGGRGVFQFEISLIHWLESQGYNLSYVSDTDVHANPAQLLSYKAMLYMPHDEYWTRERRDGVEAAIASGVSAAFLGANSSYWQCRLSVDAASNANRSITCYKVKTGNANLSLDPFYGVDNTRVTSLWRDAVLNRPENTMIGIMYSDFHSNTYVAWAADASMDTTYTAGTGLVAGASYGTDLVGYEWDKIQAGGPANLKTIATTGSLAGSVVNPDTSNTTWYKAASGALVFASGSIGFTFGLDFYRYPTLNSKPVVPQIQVLMGNIMGALKGPVYGNIGH